jgi:colanic acid biosynthesis glycosyl transferase WcaI
MKVFSVCDVFHPSAESTSQLFTELFNRLAAGGLLIGVVTNRLPGCPELLKTAVPLDPRIRVWRVGLPIRGRGSVVLRAVRYAAFLVTASARLMIGEADRLWGGTNPPFTPAWIALIAMIRRKPFDVIVHDVYPDGLVAVGYLRPHSLVVRAWSALNRWAYRRANKVVVLGRDMANLMRERYGVSERQLVVFPNWSPFDQATPVSLADSSLARQLGYGQRFVVQYSGNMGLWHDIDAFVKAADILRNDDRIRFLMIGEGRRLEPARQLAERLGLTTMIWRGFQNRDALTDSLACSSVSLISQRDGLDGVAVPCKLYGILASGRAVLAAVPPACEVARVIEEERCGVVVPPSDPEAIAAAIKRMADDADATAAMGQQSFEAYRKTYSLDAAVDRFWKVWMPAHEHV